MKTSFATLFGSLLSLSISSAALPVFYDFDTVADFNAFTVTTAQSGTVTYDALDEAMRMSTGIGSAPRASAAINIPNLGLSEYIATVNFRFSTSSTASTFVVVANASSASLTDGYKSTIRPEAFSSLPTPIGIAQIFNGTESGGNFYPVPTSNPVDLTMVVEVRNSGSVKQVDLEITGGINISASYTDSSSAVTQSGDYFGLTLLNPNVSVEIDSLEITAIPEPSSIALISGIVALGALLVMRRRRA